MLSLCKNPYINEMWVTESAILNAQHTVLYDLHSTLDSQHLCTDIITYVYNIMYIVPCESM